MKIFLPARVLVASILCAMPTGIWAQNWTNNSPRLSVELVERMRSSQIEENDSGPSPFPSPSPSPSPTAAAPFSPRSADFGPTSVPPTEPTSAIAAKATPEIQRLAYNLRYDAWSIFEFCYDQIEYDHYFGSLKGATLTLYERSGNSFDTSALMVALLRESGYENVRYRFGARKVFDTSIARWLGLADNDDSDPSNPTAFPHLSDADFLDYAGAPPGDLSLRQWRFAVSRYNYALKDGFPDVDWTFAPASSTLLVYYIPHVWVQFTDHDGQTWEIDPSYKLLEPRTSGWDILSAADADPAELLSLAGGTETTYGIKNLDEAAINEYLNNKSTQLVAALEAAAEDDLTQVLAFRSRAKGLLNIRDDWQSVTLDENDYSSTTDIGLQTWEFIPEAWMSRIRLSFGNYDFESESMSTLLGSTELSIPEISGKRISARNTSSGRTILNLEDSFLFDFTAGEDEVDWLIEVLHPWDGLDGEGLPAEPTTSRAYYKRTKRLGTGTDDYYTLYLGINPSGRLIRTREANLNNLLQEPDLDASELLDARIESLYIIGLRHVFQEKQAARIAAAHNNIHHPRFSEIGIVKQEGQDLVIDVALSEASFVSPYNDSDAVRATWRIATNYGSALEHSVIEQAGDDSAAAVSSVRMLKLANTLTNGVVLLTPQNKTAGISFLSSQGFSASRLNKFEEILEDPNDENAYVLTPSIPSMQFGQWQGLGWIQNNSHSGSWAISGGNNGGGSANPTVIDPYQVNEVLERSANPSRVSDLDPASSEPAHNTETFTAADPVNMLTGAFELTESELATSHEPPLGLSFVRSYDSRKSQQDSAGLGRGWTHNLLGQIDKVFTVDPALGGGTARQAAPLLVASALANQIAIDGDSARHRMATILIIHWAIDQIRASAQVVTLGPKRMTYVRLPDGSYVPPAGSRLELIEDEDGFQLSSMENNERTFHFDSEGQLTSLIDRNGNQMIFSYDTDGLHEVNDALGRSLEFTWSDSRISTVRLVGGSRSKTVSYVYDKGNLVRVEDSLGTLANFAYDDKGRMTTLFNAKGETIATNEYDDDGRVIRQMMQGDEDKEWSFYYSGSKNSTLDPHGNVSSFYYDEQGRTIGAEDPNGLRNSFSYDGSNNLIAYHLPSSDSNDFRPSSETYFTQQFDTEGHLVLRQTPYRLDPDSGLPLTESWIYDNGRLQEMVDRNGNSLSFQYSSNGDLQSVYDETGQEILRFGYNSLGLLSTKRDAEGRTESITYDSYGFPQQITYPDSSSVQLNWDPLGRLESYSDERGKQTVFQYDSRDRLIRILQQSANGSEPTLTFERSLDLDGFVTATTDPVGNTTEFTYSPEGAILSTTLPAINAGARTFTYHYDRMNRLTKISDSIGTLSQFHFDAAGRLSSISDAGGTSQNIEYDSRGWPQQRSDGEGNSWQGSFDTFGLLLSETDPMGNTLDHSYDLSGNRTALGLANGGEFQLEYDPFGRITQITDPLGNQTELQWTADGLLTGINFPSNKSTSFEWDLRNRLKSETYSSPDKPDSTLVIFRDLSGNILSLQQSTQEGDQATNQYSNDGHDRLVSFEDEDENIIGYEYNQNGLVTKITYPDNTSVEYDYDALGNLVRLTDWAGRTTRFEHDIRGRLTRQSRPNGSTLNFVYKSDNRLRAFSDLDRDGQVILFSYLDYDRSGRIISSRGNRAAFASSIFEHSLTFLANNQIESIDETTALHDADGNLLSGPTPISGNSTFEYDERNRLISDGTSEYRYGVNGILRKRVDPEGTTTFLTETAAGLSRVLMKIDPDGRTTKYVYGYGLLYAEDHDNEPSYYHFDLRGNTRVVSTASGEITGRYDYTIHGDIVAEAGSRSLDFGLGGRFGMVQQPSGLVYARARFFNPSLARFLNPDPIGLAAGTNFYAYAGADPVNFVDPSGYEKVGSVAVGNLDGTSTGTAILSHQQQVENVFKNNFVPVDFSLDPAINFTQKLVNGPIADTVGFLDNRYGNKIVQPIQEKLSQTLVFATYGTKISNVLERGSFRDWFDFMGSTVDIASYAIPPVKTLKESYDKGKKISEYSITAIDATSRVFLGSERVDQFWLGVGRAQDKAIQSVSIGISSTKNAISSFSGRVRSIFP